MLFQDSGSFYGRRPSTAVLLPGPAGPGHMVYLPGWYIPGPLVGRAGSESAPEAGPAPTAPGVVASSHLAVEVVGEAALAAASANHTADTVGRKIWLAHSEPRGPAAAESSAREREELAMASLGGKDYETGPEGLGERRKGSALGSEELAKDFPAETKESEDLSAGTGQEWRIRRVQGLPTNSVAHPDLHKDFQNKQGNQMGLAQGQTLPQGLLTSNVAHPDLHKDFQNKQGNQMGLAQGQTLPQGLLTSNVAHPDLHKDFPAEQGWMDERGRMGALG